MPAGAEVHEVEMLLEPVVASTPFFDRVVDRLLKHAKFSVHIKASFSLLGRLQPQPTLWDWSRRRQGKWRGPLHFSPHRLLDNSGTPSRFLCQQ